MDPSSDSVRTIHRDRAVISHSQYPGILARQIREEVM
jgi:hypothetical protein